MTLGENSFLVRYLMNWNKKYADGIIQKSNASVSITFVCDGYRGVVFVYDGKVYAGDR